jgi:transposase
LVLGEVAEEAFDHVSQLLERFELLTDAQWELIAPLLPEPKRRKDNRGRPWASNRACLEGILWVLQTGAAWRFLPDKYPSPPPAGGD